MVGAEARPLLVCDTSGVPLDLVSQNEKGFRKTTEQGALWALHPETGRLLPYPGGEGATIEDRGAWYRATLPAGREATAARAARSADGGAENLDGSAGDTGDPRGEPSGSDLGAVLTRLAELIRSRHADLPEGSYTTHLFTSGGEKIRKKLGEEAIELVLATDQGEIAGESADLLYHLLVMLEHEGIGLSEVARELERR